VTVETPIEITHLPSKLHDLFDGHLGESKNGDATERDRNFLTRALAAFAVHKLARATPEAAAKSVVDGGGDGGLDAIYYSPSDQKLWIIQSKLISSGRGEPDLGGFVKFITGVRNLLTGRFDAFEANEPIQKLIPTLKVYFNNPALQVRAGIVYSGVQLLSDDRKREVENLKAHFYQHDGYLDFSVCNLTTVHDWLTGGDEDLGVEQVELELLNPGWVTDTFETIYGIVPLEAIANLYRDHGKKLIARKHTRVQGSDRCQLRDHQNHRT
jgi:hypothetical protein